MLTVQLTPDERAALERAAELSMRPVRDHARWLIVQALGLSHARMAALPDRTSLTVIDRPEVLA